MRYNFLVINRAVFYVQVISNGEMVEEGCSFCVLLRVLLINVMMFKLLYWLEGWLIQSTALDI